MGQTEKQNPRNVIQKKTAREMAKYGMTLDYASFAHGARDNERKERGPTLLERR